MASTLVLLRHGQSEWNKKNVFTGFFDCALSEEGKAEATGAKELLKDYQFDAVFTSVLKRAIDTAKIVLADNKNALWFSDAHLNERCYGELEGKNKDEARKLYGNEQVEKWRRSFDVRPPKGESLKDTCGRVLPYYKREIEPRLFLGQTVLVSAHGNSLRALVKYLEGLGDDEIASVEIPTAVPLVYRLDDQGKIIEKNILKRV